MHQRGRNVLAPAGEKTSHAHQAAADDEPEMVHDCHGLAYLQNTARERRNVFEALMDAVKTHSLRKISHALYDVGGEVSADYVRRAHFNFRREWLISDSK